MSAGWLFDHNYFQLIIIYEKYIGIMGLNLILSAGWLFDHNDFHLIIICEKYKRHHGSKPYFERGLVKSSTLISWIPLSVDKLKMQNHFFYGKYKIYGKLNFCLNDCFLYQYAKKVRVLCKRKKTLWSTLPMSIGPISNQLGRCQ